MRWSQRPHGITSYHQQLFPIIKFRKYLFNLLMFSRQLFTDRTVTCCSASGPGRHEQLLFEDEQPCLHSIPASCHHSDSVTRAGGGCLWGHGQLPRLPACHCFCVHRAAHLLCQASPRPSNGCLARHARGAPLLILAPPPPRPPPPRRVGAPFTLAPSLGPLGSLLSPHHGPKGGALLSTHHRCLCF